MRRKFGLSLILGAALPLAVASVAWACGVLATLKLDKRVVAPGQAVNLTGKNYSTAATASQVTIRLKNRKGPVLATTAPGAGGKLDTNVKVPESLSPGWYVVVATQTVKNAQTGEETPKAGTPGRTSMRVQGASQSSGTAAAPWGSAGNPSGPAGSARPVVDGGSPAPLPTILAVVLSLTMLAGGWALVSRRSRTVTGPQFGL